MPKSMKNSVLWVENDARLGKKKVLCAVVARVKFIFSNAIVLVVHGHTAPNDPKINPTKVDMVMLL